MSKKMKSLTSSREIAIMKLISHQEANVAIHHLVQLRRLRLHDISSLTKTYFYEKERVLALYEQISKMHDVKRLNFAFDFNINSRYIEHCKFNNIQPDKELVIEKIVIFLRTRHLIKQYLKELEKVGAKALSPDTQKYLNQSDSKNPLSLSLSRFFHSLYYWR